MSSFKYETPAQSYLANRILPGGAEDRSFIKLFPQYMDVHQLWNGRRKIFLDVGASTYESSVVWFREKYPVTFDEIHVWEAEAGKFRIPPSEDRTFASKIIDHSPVMVDVPERGPDKFDLTKFVLNTIRPDDFAVLKMDIEGAEWRVLPHLIQSGALTLIDEMFVEIHFAHPSMTVYGWDSFREWNLELALQLLDRCRLETVCHYWP